MDSQTRSDSITGVRCRNIAPLRFPLPSRIRGVMLATTVSDAAVASALESGHLLPAEAQVASKGRPWNFELDGAVKLAVIGEMRLSNSGSRRVAGDPGGAWSMSQ